MQLLARPCVLVASFLVLVSGGRARADDEQYANEELGFRLEIPEGWTRAEQTRPGMLLGMTLTPPDGSMVQLTVMVANLTSFGDAEAARSMTEISLQGQEDYSNVRHSERLVAGQDAPALVIDANAGGVALRLEQIYVAGDDHLYILQSFAPEQDFDEWDERIAEVWSTLTLTAASPERQAARRLEELAARCGSELPWAASWEEAATRARAEKKLVLVHARVYRGFTITDDVMAGAYMDPPIVDLVRERYVPFRLGPDLAVPFAAHDVYGMSGTTFGTATLLVTPDGEVVHEGPYPSWEFLLAGLTIDPAYPGPPAPKLASPTETAAMHLRRGETELAEELLEKTQDAHGFLLHARLHTWRRQGAEALAAIERARGARGAEALDVDLEVQEAIVRMGLGESEHAERLLRGVVEASEGHARHTEASYRLGLLKAYMDDRQGAETMFRDLIDERPDDRWAWIAAATLTSTSWALEVGAPLAWPEEDLIGGLLLPPARTPLAAADHARGASAALAYVLEHQREDGSWFTSTELATGPDGPPHHFQLAAAAICGQGLLPYRVDEGAARAVERALDWLLPAYEKERMAELPKSFMDYTVWSRAYMLWFLADCVVAGVRDVEALRPAAELLAKELADLQKPGGGWSYYLSSDLSTVDDPTSWAMSFTTAAIVLSLLRAQEAGFELPEGMLGRGLDCMESMRNDNDTFEYMRGPDMEMGGNGNARPGAAGRGPVCALALYRGGRGSLDEIRRMLDVYVEHRAGLTKEAFKYLMHTGPDAQGSHYVMFDYATCAAATLALPPPERVRYRDAIREELLRTHCEDDSFLGNPIISAATSTGLALIAFEALARGE